jgi:hypothetical protein
MSDRDGQFPGSQPSQRLLRVLCGGAQPRAEPRADLHQPLDARVPVEATVNGDTGVLGAPARTLADPLSQIAQSKVQTGQVSATPAPLRDGFVGDRPPRHVAGQAIP